MMQWWGDKTGSQPTMETSRTQQAALEAFGGIFPESPFYDCSEPYHCYCDNSPLWNNPSQYYFIYCKLIYGNGFLIAEDERRVYLNGLWNEFSWSPVGGDGPVNGGWNVVCEATLIQLAFFTAVAKSEKVIIHWSTESEIDHAGFNIYRSVSENGAYFKINSALIPAKGSATQGAAYEFIDADVKNRKTYWYKLEDVDLNGTATMHGPVSAAPRLMFGFRD